jgi:hypothetical protein
MLKLAQNPPPLHPPVSSIRELAGRWWVAHTKGRNEGLVMSVSIVARGAEMDIDADVLEAME